MYIKNGNRIFAVVRFSEFWEERSSEYPDRVSSVVDDRAARWWDRVGGRYWSTDLHNISVARKETSADSDPELSKIYLGSGRGKNRGILI